jgi:hypothetical protein
MRSSLSREYGKTRVMAGLMAIIAFTASATGDEPHRDDSSTPAPAPSSVATCHPARLAASAVNWSCVIAADGAGAAVVHGLSGIYYDKATSTLWAASDDDTTYPGDPARLLRFHLDATPALSFRGVLSLTRRGPVAEHGSPRTWQLEAITPVIEAGAWNGMFFVATEHDALESGLSSRIYRCTNAGACEPALVMPRELESATGTTGLQDNEGIEGLAVSPDGARLFAAIEGPLAQERPPAGERGRVRLIEYALDDLRTPAHQYAYVLDPAPARMAGSPGVSEILALSTDRLLVLERSYSHGCGNTIRLFQVTLDPERALSPGQSVAHAVPLQKQLLIDLTDERGAFDDPKLSSALENFEGMALGPDLPDGSPTLLLVADDNRRSTQITALVSVRLSSLPTAAAQRWHDGDLPVCPQQLH